MGFLELAQTFKWPNANELLNIELNEKPRFFSIEVENVLNNIVDIKASTVLELGSWLGTSIKFFAQKCPNANLICIDTWQGSPEHQNSKEVLNVLYKTFLVNTLHLKNRLVPLKTNTIDGMSIVEHFNIEPDVIYIDAAHDYDSVLKDLETSYNLWPKAQIIGDDINWYTVRNALSTFASKYNINYRFVDYTWWLDK